MRLHWWASLSVGAAFALLAAPAIAQPQERLLSHPSQLRFDRRQVHIPAAEGLEHRLSTGTRVVIAEDHSLPLVEITVALRAGGFLDATDKPGVAELTGAMMRRGGSALRTADEIDDAIDLLGAELDTSAGTVRAGASLDCLTETLEESLGILFEILATPGFQSDRLESVRTNIQASLAARNDDPLDVMSREWDRLLYGPEHYRGRQMTAAELVSIERSDLVRFHRRAWQPANAVIAVSGDVSTGEVLQLLETHVREWQAAVGAPDATVAELWPPAEGAVPRKGVFLTAHPAPQAKVSLGHDLPRAKNWTSREILALRVLNEILGGTAGQISRINGRLRGREGLVYRALSEASTDPDQRGQFRIFLDAAPENVVRSLEICLEEIERIQTTAVSERALSVVTEEFLSRLQLRFAEADGIAGYFAEDLLLGRPHNYWYDYAKRLRSLEPADLQRAARRYLRPADLTVLVVGGQRTVTQGTTKNKQLARLLSEAVDLPARDPLTLE